MLPASQRLRGTFAEVRFVIARKIAEVPEAQVKRDALDGGLRPARCRGRTTPGYSARGKTVSHQSRRNQRHPRSDHVPVDRSGCPTKPPGAVPKHFAFLGSEALAVHGGGRFTAWDP